MSVTAVNQIYSILTVAAQISIVILLFSMIFRYRPVLDFASRNFLWLALLAALVATSGSLYYSEVAGYEPCILCWYQRILMYPQVVLLAVAQLARDPDVRKYIAVLSAIGAAIAGYHYLLQLGVAPNLPCAAVGYSVSCAQRFVLTFGYITIPLMAFSAFGLNFLLAITKRRELSAG